MTRDNEYPSGLSPFAYSSELRAEATTGPNRIAARKFVEVLEDA